MGAVTFSIDPNLLQLLTLNLDLKLFVETGTFQGDSIALAKPYFSTIYSIEFSQQYYETAKARFQDEEQIKIFHGNSAEVMAELRKEYQNQATLFWLDAHWCMAENTAGETSQCPLLGELSAIQTLHPSSIILIDDARLFLTSPPKPHEISQWPTFSSIIEQLQKLSNQHELTILNDCIIYFPKTIAAIINKFAYLTGVDWLHLYQKSQMYDQLIKKFDRDLANPLETINQLDADLKASERDRKERLKLVDQLEASQTYQMEMINHFHSMWPIKIYNQIKKIKLALLRKLSKNNPEEKPWRDVLYQEKTYGALFEQLKKQNHEIMMLKKLCDDQEKLLEKKFPPSLFKRIKKYFTPRLGKLNQYPPRTLVIPEAYHQKSKQKNSLATQLPSISIVTPAFNHAEFLERTLNSVLEQKYPKLEYIVQDGGSTDESPEILKRYHSALKHWESSKDNGQSHAINLGFLHATGDIMGYLNSDDLLLPGTLHYVGEYFAQHPNVDVVYGHRVVIDEYDQEIGRWIMPRHNSKVLSWADYVPQETLFWRRSIWEKSGAAIDESFKFAMDWDLLLRFRESGARIVRLPRFLGAFRVHPQQKTSSVLADMGAEEMARIRLRCNGHIPTYKEINKSMRFYFGEHFICHKLYKLGLLRY